MVQIGYFLIDLKTNLNLEHGLRSIQSLVPEEYFFGGVRPYKEKNLGGLTYYIVKSVIFTMD